MAVTADEIELRYSGGATNTDPNLSIGDDMSTVDGGIVQSNQLNNDMDDITGAESVSGTTIYRVYYGHNSNDTQPLLSTSFWIDSQTSSSDSVVNIGTNHTSHIPRLDNENTAPPMVDFFAAANARAGFTFSRINPNSQVTVIVQYIVNSGSTAFLDTYTLAIQGETNP